jgi:uncharacterized membrane protein YbaN (DUF454 family)
MNTATEFESNRTEKTFTRWLVRGNVMFNILMNWEELKAYITADEIAQSV